MSINIEKSSDPKDSLPDYVAYFGEVNVSLLPPLTLFWLMVYNLDTNHSFLISIVKFKINIFYNQ